jgi:hypothetical protein
MLSTKEQMNKDPTGKMQFAFFSLASNYLKSQRKNRTFA